MEKAAARAKDSGHNYDAPELLEQWACYPFLQNLLHNRRGARGLIWEKGT